jgi:hypothetical protein
MFAPYAQQTSPAYPWNGYPQSPAAEPKPNTPGQPPQQDPRPQPQQQELQQQEPQQQEPEKPAAKTPAKEKRGKSRSNSTTTAITTTTSERSASTTSPMSAATASPMSAATASPMSAATASPMSAITTTQTTFDTNTPAFGETVLSTEEDSYKPYRPEPFLVQEWTETLSTPLAAMAQNENLFKFKPNLVGAMTVTAECVTAVTETNPAEVMAEATAEATPVWV